ncbi:MAG: hypothetical protein ABI634_12740 [Acidobacteriota bacterium]
MSGLARFVRRVAVLAVLLGLAGPSFAPGHTLTETDRDCGPLVLGADHATQKISSVQPPVQDEHCAFCHWHRAFGNAAPMAVAAVVPDLDTMLAVAVADDHGSAAMVVGLRPARAPPAFDTL